MPEPEKVIVLEDNEQQNEDITLNSKRSIETGVNQNSQVKKQRSIPNIANELARNRAEVRLPAISTNKLGNVTPQERPRLHAIPLASLLSPSVDYNYSSASPTPPIAAPFTSNIPKSEMQATLPQLLDNQNSRLKQGNNSGKVSTAESAELKGVSSGKSSSTPAKQGSVAAPAKKSTTRRRKNDGSSVAGGKKAASDGGKGSGKKASSKTPKKEEPVATAEHQSPSVSPTSNSINSGRKVILPSQDGNSAPSSNSTPPQAPEETDEQNILIARISSPVNAPNQKGLKRTQSNLNPASKGTTQDSLKAKKTLSASNVVGAATPTPPPAPASSAVPVSSKKTSNAGTCKRDAKGKAKQGASKKKDSSVTPAPVAADANTPPTNAPQTPKKLVPPQPIKSPSLIDVFDQKSQGGSQDDDDIPIIVLDVPLYQVGVNDYLDENGQVVFNFYNLVQEKFGSQNNPRSRNANSGGSKGENSEDVDMVEEDEDEDEEAEEDEEGGVATSTGMSPPKGTKKKVNPLKGKSRVGKYDIDDPFIDDSELLWEEQRAATKDGFFVYFGPLIQKGQYATFERVDGTMKKGGVRNPR